MGKGTNTRNLNVESTGTEGQSLVYAKRRMTTTMSSLPEDLVAEILSRVPMASFGSVRSTCKLWNALSKNQIFGKVAKNQFLGFMMKDFRICSVRMDIQGIDSIDLSIRHVSVLNLNQIEVSKVYHCDGLLLCTLTDKSRLLVWNPYLSQRRWIPHVFDSYDGFSLGYDKSGNHKILQILDFYNYKKAVFGFKIYDFSSNSWRDLDVTRHIRPSGVTLKGNVYFYACKDIIVEGAATKEHFLLCFDFTSERFGPRLSLPFHHETCDTVMLSRVRDEQFAVLYQRMSSPKIMEIWVTNKIEYNEVLWTKWMKVDIYHYFHRFLSGSFFINEEKKVVVVFDLGRRSGCYPRYFYQDAHIIGEDGYMYSIYDEEYPYEVKDNLFMLTPFCSSYVPSLMQFA